MDALVELYFGNIGTSPCTRSIVAFCSCSLLDLVDLLYVGPGVQRSTPGRAEALLLL